MIDKCKPAVGYIRMSTDQQQDSPARQRKDIQALADRSGYHILRWYEDHGLTGTESGNRKNFQRLLADAKSKTFCAVLLSEQSRMSREDIFDAMVHWKLLRDAGVKIVTFQRGELDFSNLGGVITAIVDQYGAREESLKLADRVVSGKRLAISKGQKQGGALFGYDREILDETGRVVRCVAATEKFRRPLGWSSRLVPASDSQTVEAVRTMFESVAGGVSCGAVARELNRQGIRTMLGKRFKAGTVRRIVTNATYIGKIVAGRRRCGKFRSLHDEGGVVCEDAHEPLVTPALFNRAQRMLQRNRRPARASTPGKYLLTGLVFLADGRRLRGCATRQGNRGSRRRYYALPPSAFEQFPEETDRPSFHADTIERAVLAKLQMFMADERTKRAIRTEISRRTRKVDTSASRIETQLSDARSRIERGTRNLALANPEDIPGISTLLSGWRDEEKQLKERLRKIRSEQAPSPEALEVVGRLDELVQRLSEADREKLMFAIRQTVERVTLRRKRRGAGKQRITRWTGAIELRDDLGVPGTIPLTDDDIPAPGRWREVVDYVRKRGGSVFFRDVSTHFAIPSAYASRLLAQGVLGGKLRHQGPRKGWIAVE